MQMVARTQEQTNILTNYHMITAFLTVGELKGRLHVVNAALVTIRELKGGLGDVGQYKNAWLKGS